MDLSCMEKLALESELVSCKLAVVRTIRMVVARKCHLLIQFAQESVRKG